MYLNRALMLLCYSILAMEGQGAGYYGRFSRFNIGLIIRRQRTVLALRIISSYVHSETSSLLLLYKISALICLGSLVRGPISSVIKGVS